MDNPAVLLLSEVYGTIKGGISTIYRRLATVLRERIRVSSAVLEATEDDKEDAKCDAVELLLPTVDSGDERTHPSLHWLTFDHRVKYPHLPLNTQTIVGHIDGTSRAACGIKQGRCSEARVVLFIDDIPEDTEKYQGDEEAMGIGKKEESILKDAQEADVVFSIGDRTFDHFKNQFRAIPANKRPQHMKFLPRPSKTFEDSDAEYSEAETMVVLCICRVAGVEKLKGLDLAVEALSLVAGKMRVKLRVRGVNKGDLQTTILEHRKSANLQITFLPYGTQKDICKDMLQSHLVLMPSRAEPFGLVGLEAIAAGVPVLVSDKSGLADLINTFAPRYHNCIVKTEISGNDEINVVHWAACIEKVLDHCKEEFDTAASFKTELLSTRYWEQSERHFIDVCKGEETPGAEFGDQLTQDNGGSRGSSSDEESLNYSILRISEQIFNEEVLQDAQKFESKVSIFKQHVDTLYPRFKRTLSCKAKLRVKRKVDHQVKKVNKVLFSGRRLETMYDKMVECFTQFCAILTKIEEGCVLCTLEFDDTLNLKSFLRGYRDGKLSETLTQDLITEEMKQEGGPDLFVHVTLLVAACGTERSGDEDDRDFRHSPYTAGSKQERTLDRPQGDGEMQDTIASGASGTLGLKKSISLNDLYAMQSPPVQIGIPQPGIINLDLATTGVQDSRLKGWACDPLTNQLALRLAKNARHVQELKRKMKTTVELHNNKAAEQSSIILKLSAEFKELTQKIESAEKVLSDKNTEIQQQNEDIKNLTAINEDLQAENTKLDAKMKGKETKEQDLEAVATTDVSEGGKSDVAPTARTPGEPMQTDEEQPSEQRHTSPALEQTGHEMEDISSSEKAHAGDISQGLLQTGAQVPPDSDPHPAADVFRSQRATSPSFEHTGEMGDISGSKEEQRVDILLESLQTDAEVLSSVHVASDSDPHQTDVTEWERVTLPEQTGIKIEDESTYEDVRTAEATQKSLQVGTEVNWAQRATSVSIEASDYDPNHAIVVGLQATLPTPEQTGLEMKGVQRTLVKMEALLARLNISQLKDPQLVDLYKNLATLYSQPGKTSNAMSNYALALAVANESNNEAEQMEVYFWMGEMYREQLRSQRNAIQSYEQYLIIAKDLMNRQKEGLAYNRLGLAYYEIGEYDQGYLHHQKSLIVVKDDEDTMGMIMANINLGNTARLQGELDQAYFHFDTASQMAQQAGDRRSQMEVYFWMGEMHMEQLHSPRAAVTYYERHLALAKEFADRQEESVAYNRLGMANYEAEKYEVALEWHQKSLDMVQDIQSEQAPHANIGDCYKALDKLYQAKHHYQLALIVDTGHTQRQENIAKKVSSLAIVLHSDSVMPVAPDDGPVEPLYGHNL